MKKVLISIIFLLSMTACAKRMPPPPRTEFSGIMQIFYGYRDTAQVDQVRAHFRVNGFRNQILIVFSDLAGIPRGEANVRNRRIDYSGIDPGGGIIRFLEYWPLVFNPAGGDKIDIMELDDIKIKYGQWVKTVKGSFPEKVEILSPDFLIRLEIVYGI